jgi:Fur family transcriptional regulator, peroxide stress response regulator
VAKSDIGSIQLQQRMDRFIDTLKRAGLKSTPQRLQIFREVALSCDHPDAETVWKAVRQAMPNVSLDTVYRTLWLFVDLGLIATLAPDHERTRFDANMRPHHHFRCTECGTVYDFYSEEFDRLLTPESVRSVGNVENTQVQLSGICLNCLKESRTGLSELKG